LKKVAGKPVKGWNPFHPKKPVLPPINKEDAIDFVSALTNKLINKNKFDDIKVCLKDNEKVAGQVQVALQDFEKKNLRGVLAGIKAIGGILQEVPEDVNDCIAIKSDVDRIVAWAAIFKQPLNFAKTVGGNVKKNLVDILQDVATNAKDVSKDDWKGAGRTIADIMIKSLGPVPELEFVGEEDNSFVDQIDNLDIDNFANKNLSSD